MFDSGFFGIGIPEMIIIAIVALVFIGPERLPGVLRNLGNTIANLRSGTDGLRQEFLASMAEVRGPLEELRAPFEELRAPFEEVRSALAGVQSDGRRTLEELRQLYSNPAAEPLGANEAYLVEAGGPSSASPRPAAIEPSSVPQPAAIEPSSVPQPTSPVSAGDHAVRPSRRVRRVPQRKPLAPLAPPGLNGSKGAHEQQSGGQKTDDLPLFGSNIALMSETAHAGGDTALWLSTPSTASQQSGSPVSTATR